MKKQSFSAKRAHSLPKCVKCANYAQTMLKQMKCETFLTSLQQRLRCVATTTMPVPVPLQRSVTTLRKLQQASAY